MDNRVICRAKSKKSFQLDREKARKLRQKYKEKLLRKEIELSENTPIDFYYDLKVNENSILVVGLGTNVRGNMQYILNELNHNDRYERFTIYVRTKDETMDEIVSEYIKKNHWDRTKTLLKGYGRKLETCKYLITESFFPYGWIKRQEQVMIDLWHGTPLKCLGLLKSGRKAHKSPTQQKNFLCADYLLYPNDYTRQVMWDSYKITSLLPGKALMMGYPRTAGMLGMTSECIDGLKKELAPNGEKIYAYMPTFRGHLTDEETLKRETVFLDFLDRHLGDDQKLYVNLHHHISQGLNFEQFKHIEKFPPLIDSYELLTVTDALISDYSSVFFDYLVLGKQIILHVADYDEYLRHQGLNMDIRELPFDLADSKEEVVEMLARGKDYDDTQYRARMCRYDDADNPSRLCRMLVGDESDVCVEEIPGNDKRKILVYSEGCREGIETELLKKVIENHRGDQEIYIGCDETKINQHIDDAYPLLHKARVIASRDNVSLSSVGAPIKELYMKRRMNFSRAMRYLVHEYALTPRKMYGDIQFNHLAIFDTTNPEMIIGLALSPAKEKSLFVNPAILTLMKEGDCLMKDAVRFAADYCHAVVVRDPVDIKFVESILPRYWHKKISLVTDEKGLCELWGVD